MEDVLGILGGMGPMASQHFCKLVISHTKASRDQDHINFVLLNHATMPDRTAAILSQDQAEIARVQNLLLADCRVLESLGAKAICVPCNTSHYMMHRIEPELKAPLLSLIRETAKEMGRRHKGERVAVLGTTGTVKTGLYQDALRAEGVEPYVPSPESQARIMHLIYDCVKAGKPGDPDDAAHVEQEIRAAGCEEALLACTELPLLCEEGLFDDPFFFTDPMEILACAAVSFMGKEVVSGR